MTSPSAKQQFKSADDAQRFIVQTVYDRFRETGEWPLARDFDLAYYQLLDPFGGLEVLCRQIGNDRISPGSPNSPSDRIALRLVALAACRGAEGDVKNFLAAVQLGADRYHSTRGNDAHLEVSDLVESLEIDEASARRVLELMLTDGGVSGGGGGGRVSLSLLASRMRGVASVEDYLSRVAAASERQLALAQVASGRPAHRPPRPARRIFLSHAADDATLAHYLADVIRRGSPGVRVFVASKAGDIPTGSDWLDAIETELRQADTYLLLLTPHSSKRFWLWYESGAAWMSDRPLVPVTAAGLAKSEVLFPLGARQALSLEVPSDVGQLARDLGATIDDPEQFCKTVRELSESLPWRQPDKSQLRASVRVTLSRSPDHFVLTNDGPGPARSVNLRVDEPRNPIVVSEALEKLPVPLLESGQSCPILIAITMGNAPPYHGVLEWTDPDDQRQTREWNIYG